MNEMTLLLRTAGQNADRRRQEIGQVITDLLGERQELLTERERSLIFDILRRLVGDVEASLRQRLGNHLADRDDAPRDLIRFLAHDDIEIAYPILARSRVLRDEDLIEVIRHRGHEHQLAVTIRCSLSAQVCSELVGTGRESVIRALLNNPNAEISHATLEYLVDQAERVDTFHEPLVRRRDLPPDLARRLFLWVSTALRQHILASFDIDMETVDDLLEQVAVRELGQEGGAKPEPDKAGALADALNTNAAASPDLIVDVLRTGEVRLVCALLARTTGVRDVLIRRFLFEPGGEALVVVCKALAFPKPAFASFFTLTRRGNPAYRANLRKDLRRVLGMYDRTTSEAALRIVRHWQRSEDYLAALRALAAIG